MNKNNKILIYEIAKMQKLMTGTLILEQFTDLIDDFLVYAGKLAGKLPDNVEQLIAKLSKTATEDEIIKVLAEISKSSDELSQFIVPKIMRTMSDVERKYINEFKLAIKEAINNGMDVDRVKSSAEDWVEKNIKTEFEGIKDLIKKDLTDYSDNVARKVNPPASKPSTPKPKPNNITDIAGQTWENIKPLSPNELKKLEKLYRQKGLGQSFFKSMRIFRKSVEDMMTKQTELMDETLSLIKSYETVTNAAQRTDIAKRIGNNVKILTQRDKTNYEIINEWIDTNVIDYKVKGKTKGIDGYINAAHIFDGKSLEEWKKKYKVLSDRRKQILLQLNSVVNPASWAPGVMKSKFGTERATSYWLQVGEKWKQIVTGPKFAELRRYASTGQSQSWSGLNDFRKKFGFIPAIGNVAKEYLLNYVVLSISLAAIDFMTDYLGTKSRKWGLPDIKLFGYSSEEWLENQAKSWDQHINPEKVNNTTEIEKSVKGGLSLLGDIFSYLKDELTEIQVVIPGLIDDLLSMYFVSRNDEATEEEIETAIKKGEELRNKIENEREKIIDKSKEIVKSEETVKTYSSDLFYKEYPCYTSILNTNYNENGFVKGIKIVSPTEIQVMGNTNETYSATLKTDKRWYFTDGTQIKCQ